MGSCCSCPDTHSLSDDHHSKFKVINVDDDGNELGSGVMELTDEELILHTRRREPVNWPYLCLRRYGCDSNLFSFESGRRCQTGQGIFAFKCVRAEEIFNMLQETMHSNSISVVEEAVLEPGQGPLDPDAPRTPRTPTTPGYSVPTVANGIARYPSFGEASSRPSSRHPSIGSARLPSVGEEATHPLLVTDDPVHTYVNTSGVQEDRRSRPSSHTPLELWLPNPDSSSATPANQGTEVEPQVVLEGESVKFVLGPTPVQRQKQRRVGDRETGPGPGGVEPGAGVGAGGTEDGAGQRDREREPGSGLGNESLEPNGPNDCVTQSAECDTGYDSDERKDAPPPPPLPPQSSAKLSYEHHNGTSHVSTPAPFSVPNPAPRRNRPALPSPDFSHNANNSAQRRTALLNYENLPSLPPVWETPKRFSAGEDEEDEEEDEDEESYGRPKTLNGYHRRLHHRPHHHHHHHHPLQHPLLDPMHNYVNTENVTMPLSAKLDSARLPRREGGGGGGAGPGTPTVFNFEFRGAGGLDPLRQLNYIEVEMEKGSDSSGPHTPKTPTTPLLGPPPPPARRTELYAVIDIERTAAMSSLQKALPRDDGTSRKTRHNSTDLPM
ncbi:fibroblast growth factor receptor substrate 2a [Osmerus mordax]|uniref:fibroblast growth factor receptor substrate 2a n=1 Tax=Osmerus mordax TaxID=8014 RepID=UPI003510925F